MRAKKVLLWLTVAVVYLWFTPLRDEVARRVDRWFDLMRSA